MFQRILVLLQNYNAVLIHDSLPTISWDDVNKWCSMFTSMYFVMITLQDCSYDFGKIFRKSSPSILKDTQDVLELSNSIPRIVIASHKHDNELNSNTNETYWQLVDNTAHLSKKTVYLLASCSTTVKSSWNMLHKFERKTKQNQNEINLRWVWLNSLCHNQRHAALLCHSPTACSCNTLNYQPDTSPVLIH